MKGEAPPTFFFIIRGHFGRARSGCAEILDATQIERYSCQVAQLRSTREMRDMKCFICGEEINPAGSWFERKQPGAGEVRASATLSQPQARLEG